MFPGDAIFKVAIKPEMIWLSVLGGDGNGARATPSDTCCLVVAVNT